MDVSGIANLASSMSQARSDDAISLALLKKTMDMQASIAAQMIATVNAVPTVSNLPAHIGQNVNTVA